MTFSGDLPRKPAPGRSIDSPHALRKLPPLAGLCDFQTAQRPGMSVEECVAWLKRLHYVLFRLNGIFTARITAEPLYELKTAFSLHAYLCAEHVSALRTRVGEMREPPLGLDDVPHPALKLLCDEVLAVPETQSLLEGAYGVLVPELIRSFDEYVATTNPLTDAPSVRVARFALLELGDMEDFGRQALECFRAALADAAVADAASVSANAGLVEARDIRIGADAGSIRHDAWRQLLTECLQAAGGLSGRIPHGQMAPVPMHASHPYKFDPVPRRDERFHDSYNAGVNPEAFLYDDRFADRDKVLMLFYKRLREIDVPEMLAGVIAQTSGHPWKFYRDMTRQLWDEARHAMLGEVGFVSLGLDWSQIPINFTWSLNLNTQLDPQERHAVLYFIEQGLMPKTGKRYEWEVAKRSGLPLAALFQDFDWADEVLHSQLGREWYVPGFPDLKAALDYGDRCWSKVMSHWRQYQDDGLTAHRNWWPDLYSQACARWGVTPDPTALAFHETYEEVRADLKTIAGKREVGNP